MCAEVCAPYLDGSKPLGTYGAAAGSDGEFFGFRGGQFGINPRPPLAV